MTAFPSLVWTWEHMQKCHCNDHGMIHGTEYTVLVPYVIPCRISLPASVCQHLAIIFFEKKARFRACGNKRLEFYALEDWPPSLNLAALACTPRGVTL